MTQAINIDREPGVFGQFTKSGASLRHTGGVVQFRNSGDFHRSHAQGAGLATGIEFAAPKIDSAKFAAGISDCLGFAMRGRVMVLKRPVDTLANDLAIAHDDSTERFGARATSGAPPM